MVYLVTESKKDLTHVWYNWFMRVSQQAFIFQE